DGCVGAFQKQFSRNHSESRGIAFRGISNSRGSFLRCQTKGRFAGLFRFTEYSRQRSSAAKRQGFRQRLYRAEVAPTGKSVRLFEKIAGEKRPTSKPLTSFQRWSIAALLLLAAGVSEDSLACASKRLDNLGLAT